MCNMSITATNKLNREEFKILVKVDTQPTTTFTMFSVDDEELPFDEYYNVIVEFKNPPNISSQLKWPTDLSKVLIIPPYNNIIVGYNSVATY